MGTTNTAQCDNLTAQGAHYHCQAFNLIFFLLKKKKDRNLFEKWKQSENVLQISSGKKL